MPLELSQAAEHCQHEAATVRRGRIRPGIVQALERRASLTDGRKAFHAILFSIKHGSDFLRLKNGPRARVDTALRSHNLNGHNEPALYQRADAVGEYRAGSNANLAVTIDEINNVAFAHEDAPG
jgi:hypothetical protein